MLIGKKLYLLVGCSVFAMIETRGMSDGDRKPWRRIKLLPPFAGLVSLITSGKKLKEKNKKLSP